MSIVGRESLAVMPTTKKKTPLKRPRNIPTSDSSVAQQNDDEEMQIEGLKYFAMLRPLLEHLHQDQCGRDSAGNRTLHYDQYCMLVLLYVLNPTVSSLRALSQASELTKVRTKLGTQNASLGSFSESSRLFDADRLQPIIEQLSSQVADLKPDTRLSNIKQKITAVDGSLVNALPSMIAASVLKQTTGTALVRWRLHTHFEVNNLLPSRIDVTPDGGGKNDERAVLQRVVVSLRPNSTSDWRLKRYQLIPHPRFASDNRFSHLKTYRRGPHGESTDDGQVPCNQQLTSGRVL